MKKFLCIIHTKTGQIIKSTGVTDKSERQIEKMEEARNINLNKEEYHTAILTEDELNQRRGSVK